jgi:hypothetical protein
LKQETGIPTEECLDEYSIFEKLLIYYEISHVEYEENLFRLNESHMTEKSTLKIGGKGWKDIV